LLNFALAKISELIEADCGAIHLVDEESGDADLVGMYRMPEDLVPALDRIKKGEAPLSRAVGAGVYFAFPDVEELSSPSREILTAGYRSGVIMPLKVAREDRPPKILGTMTTLWRTTGAYDAETLEFLETIAAQVALSLENLRISLEREKALSEQYRIARILETMMEKSSEGIVWIRNGDIIKANPAFCRAMAFADQDAALGSRFIGLLAEDGRDRFARIIEDFERRGEPPSDTTFEMTSEGGRSGAFEASFSSVAAEEGAPIIQIAIREVTERIRFERLVKASERRYRMLIELAQQGIISINAEGGITLVNPKASLITGYESEELLDKNITILAPPDWVPVINELFLSGADTAVEQEEICFLKKDGSQVECMINAGPVLDEQNRLQGFTLFINDLSETKSLREQLYTAEKMAAIGRLAGGVAHEFNNIHAAIQGTAELLLQQPHLTDEDVEDLASIRRLVRRASHITQQLLVFARRTQPQREMTDVIDLVDSNLKIISKEYATEGINIECVHHDQIPEINLDAGRISQMLMALVINARDAILEAGEQKRITIETGKADGYAYIKVSDTGVGVGENAINKIFEPFYTTKGALGGSTIPGTGLGLSVAHAVVREHGGRIEVESELGKGAAFTVWLPLSESEKAKSATRSTPFGPALVGARVLVVDDEKDVARMIERALSRAGYRVEVALLGRQAITKLYNGVFDVILVDLQMPDLPGERVLEEARKLPEEVRPIPIIITGKAGAGSVEDFKDFGVAAVVRKPFFINTLFNAIHQGWVKSKGKEENSF